MSLETLADGGRFGEMCFEEIKNIEPGPIHLVFDVLGKTGIKEEKRGYFIGQAWEDLGKDATQSFKKGKKGFMTRASGVLETKFKAEDQVESELRENIPAEGVDDFFGPDIDEFLNEIGSEKKGRLTNQEKGVLKMRCGFGVNATMTLEEIGQTYSISRERVRQIQEKALRKIRKHLGVKFVMHTHRYE